jgi:hypothetical protein
MFFYFYSHKRIFRKDSLSMRITGSMLRRFLLFLLVFAASTVSFRVQMFEPISTAISVACVSVKAYPLLREARAERCIVRALPIGRKLTQTAIRKNGRIPTYTQRVLLRAAAYKTAFFHGKILPELSDDYESEFVSNVVEFLVDYADHMSSSLLYVDWHHFHTVFLMHFFLFH